MDSSAAKLLQRPPPQAAELPAAPPEGRLLGKLSGKQLRALAAILLVLDYTKVVLQSFGEAYDAPGAPLPWRLPVAGALAYAAAAALIWFIRRPPGGHDARWEERMKLAAHVLCCPIFFVLGFCSGTVTPWALYIFMWVGPRDHVYLGLKAYKEESEENQCQV